MIRRLLQFLKNNKLHSAGALLLGVATILTGIGLMSSSGFLISRAAQRPMLVDLFVVTAAVRFFGISRAVVRYFERVVSHELTFNILSSMRSLLFKKLDSLSLKWLMGRRSGDLLARLVADIDTLQNVYLRIISPSIVAVLITAVTCVALWFFDPVLSLAALFFFIVSGIALPVLAVRMSKGTGKKDVELKAGFKTYLIDRIHGMQELLWLGQKKNTQNEVNMMQAELDAQHHKDAGGTGLLEGLHSLLANLGMFSVLILAVPLVLTGQIPGVMLAMLTLGVLSSFEAVQNLGNAFQQYETSKEASNRFFSVTESRQVIAEPEKPKHLADWDNIGFQRVSFSYETENITLSDVSFEIPRLSKTAIVGPTGSGKSTLVSLLLRFWDPKSGQILIGGTDIRNLEADKLRSLFAVVSQDAYIFNRTLRENLLIAKPTASDDELVEVLTKVGLNAFASDLNLNLGNFGTRLSGGERRLVALARALLKDAPIWIFDEPTANLDVKTERKILDAIRATTGQRTMIMITHRLVDMDKMDQIIVMNRGQIVEKGSHAKLLDGQSFYAKMVGYQRVFR
ncbi:MAG TPA: thiol reductant ABC exporter subunit CydC [Bacteroidales bacterium]|nr:thiol reductant ABC exporter subunit CydC [Bacteroidales bacterium]